MPEGPEVRKYADALNAALQHKPITLLTARTREARVWLEQHGSDLIGQYIERIYSHGKHLIGCLEDDYFFHSHLMMWGRWQVFTEALPIAVDRRERARIEVPDATAILYSAPIFDVGCGNPLAHIEYLGTLGPDILPYPEDGAFNVTSFKERLLSPQHRQRTIGAALLDQQIVAGIGNYLRAEILFICRLDPWKPVAALSEQELGCLSKTIPVVATQAYKSSSTVPDAVRERMKDDPTLVYQPGREYGTRHYVFRRTNLPCLVCDDTIHQLRQVTREDEEGERTRIMYFCPTCQGTSVEQKPRRGPRKKNSHKEAQKRLKIEDRGSKIANE